MKKRIVIKSPVSFENERKYIFDVIFSEFLGLEYEIVFSEEAETVSILLENGFVTLNDAFFSMDKSLWLTEKSMPETPLKRVKKGDVPFDFKSVDSDIPVIYGGKNRQIIVDNGGIYIDIDIFGSAFFMLTRYEEVVSKAKDRYGRFPATASLALKENFLTRPIVNEYIEILWSALCKIDPNLKRKDRKFELVLTHDVDRPFKLLFMKPAELLKIVAADILKHRSLKRAFADICTFIAVKRGNIEKDPFNVFNKIIDMSESVGEKSHFYFITENYGKTLNSNYDFENQKIIEVVENIRKRGHVSGLHVSYDAADNAEKMKNEAQKFLKVCSEIGIDTTAFEARHHFLRVSVPESWRIMEECGIKLDLSLSFPDYAGYRCGVCYEYPLFDLLSGKRLKLRELPLTVMECSVIDTRYMGLGTTEKSFEFIKSLMDSTALFDGKFVLLWHNNRFENANEAELYRKIIKCRD